MLDAHWAETDQFPWQVSIKAQSAPNRGPVFCSGAAITTSWVLTSATCVSRASTFQLRYSSLLHYTGGLVSTSLEAVIHPFFNATTNQFNVALIFDQRGGVPNNLVLRLLPRNLPNPNLNNNFTVVPGWGRLGNLQRISPVLQFATGRILSNASALCRNNWAGSTAGRNDVMCASFNDQQGCVGDTGSPLVVLVQRVWHLAGVAAFDAASPACRQSTTLFTPLYSYRQWITNVTRIPF